MTRGRITIVQGFQHRLLFDWAKIHKSSLEHMLCYFRNSLQPKPMRLLVSRHAVESVAIKAVFVQTLVDAVDYWYLVEIIAIVLRQNSIADGGHQLDLFRRKKTD
jgi:hypothetical protein